MVTGHHTVLICGVAFFMVYLQSTLEKVHGKGSLSHVPVIGAHMCFSTLHYPHVS